MTTRRRAAGIGALLTASLLGGCGGEAGEVSGLLCSALPDRAFRQIADDAETQSFDMRAILPGSASCAVQDVDGRTTYAEFSVDEAPEDDPLDLARRTRERDRREAERSCPDFRDIDGGWMCRRGDGLQAQVITEGRRTYRVEMTPQSSFDTVTPAQIALWFHALDRNLPRE